MQSRMRTVMNCYGIRDFNPGQFQYNAGAPTATPRLLISYVYFDSVSSYVYVCGQYLYYLFHFTVCS
jgi:hypothetical protein